MWLWSARLATVLYIRPWFVKQRLLLTQEAGCTHLAIGAWLCQCNCVAASLEVCDKLSTLTLHGSSGGRLGEEVVLASHTPGTYPLLQLVQEHGQFVQLCYSSCQTGLGIDVLT